MYNEQELTAALSVISESVDADVFDAIIEGACNLLEDEDCADMSIDEAVHTAAAMLYNEDVIDESTFGVFDVVMDEFANRPIGYQEALEVLAESMTEEDFDSFMSECVSYGLQQLDEASSAYNPNFKSVDDRITELRNEGRENVKKGQQRPVAHTRAGDDFIETGMNQIIKADRLREMNNERKKSNDAPATPEKKVDAGTKGYNAGHRNGYQEGLEVGKTAGRLEGQNIGYESGHKQGFAEGEAKHAKDKKIGRLQGAAIGVGGLALAGGAIYGGKKGIEAIKNAKAKKQAAIEEAKKKSALDAAKEKGEAALNAGKEKAKELADKAKAKLSPNNEAVENPDVNESVGGAYSLADLRNLIGG